MVKYINYLNKNYKVRYRSIIKPGVKILLINGIMLLSLMIVRLFLGQFPTTRWWSLLEIVIYALIGIIIYFILSLKNNIFNEVFGKEFVNNITLKIKKVFSRN